MTKFILQVLMLFSCISSAQPYQPQVIWDRSGETDSSAYGYKILPLGDQNDDGFADWAVMAYGNIATYHGTRRPYLEFFHGGLEPSLVPYFVFQQDSPAYDQSWPAWVAGDLDDDGYQDWVTVYWPQSFPPFRIYGFFFGGHGPSSTPDMEWTASVGEGFYPFADFDFNGDGYDDLFYSYGGIESAHVYYGGNPMDTLPDWTLSAPPLGLNQIYPAAVGDFNGDGASDFICYNPNPPFNLAIFLGGANPDTVPAYFWSNMMWPIGGVNSLNGDNADEFLLDLGVHFGRDTLFPNPDTYLNSIAGHEPVSAGDFNHDGYNDLILLSPDCWPNVFGCLTLHLGHPWLNAEPAFVIEGDSPPFYLFGIHTATGLGDVNGDGIDDLAIGVWNSSFWQRGRCVMLAGDDSLQVSADDPQPAIAEELSISAYPNPFNSEATIRLAAPPSNEPSTLTIFNVLGQAVRREVLPRFSSTYSYYFDARDLPSGLYLAYVESGELHTTHKLMLLK